MADPKQLNLLKAGVGRWNKWRKDNPDTKIDLVKSDLFGTDLKEV